MSFSLALFAACARRWLAGGLLTFLAVVGTCGAAEERLVIHAMVSSGAQRSVWVQAIKRFEEAHPQIKIETRETGQEDYKAGFERMVGSGQVDLAFWFAGERLRDMAAKGLVAPLDDEFARLDLRRRLRAASIDASVHGGKTYGLPLSYYPWGLFYHRKTFARLGLAVPENWQQFLAVCARLKLEGIAPLALGPSSGWPAAAWFDYLNLRLNGLGFHQQLLRGEVSFADPRARRVFEHWKLLLDRGYFHEKTMSMDWDGVFPFLYRGQVAMTLMGGFGAARFPDEMREEIGFVRFPLIAPKVPVAEDAPLDVLVMAAAAPNRSAARKFLAFLIESRALDAYNEAVAMFSPARDAGEPRDALARDARRILDGAAGLAFFFDRDAREPMVKPAFEAFAEFLVPPHDVERAIVRLERARSGL